MWCAATMLRQNEAHVWLWGDNRNELFVQGLALRAASIKNAAYLPRERSGGERGGKKQNKHLCGRPVPLGDGVQHAKRTSGWRACRRSTSALVAEPSLIVSNPHSAMKRGCAGGWIVLWSELFPVGRRCQISYVNVLRCLRHSGREKMKKRKENREQRSSSGDIQCVCERLPVCLWGESVRCCVISSWRPFGYPAWWVRERGRFTPRCSNQLFCHIFTLFASYFPR